MYRLSLLSSIFNSLHPTALACDLLRVHGLDAPKQPAVFPDAHVLVARISDLSNARAIQSVQAIFQQLTLWTLQFAIFDPDAGPTLAPLLSSKTPPQDQDFF